MGYPAFVNSQPDIALKVLIASFLIRSLIDFYRQRFYVYRRAICKQIYDYRWMSQPNIRMSVLSQRLRQARLRAGLAQDRLGVLAGLEESSSSARMSRYESGIHEPPLKFVEVVARIIGVPTAYFYCADDRLAEIILQYAELSEAKREKLRETALQLAN